jgi:hypothetical protein
MAKTDLKDLGSKVCVGPDQDEHLIPALGNGTAVPGDLCYRDPATGKVLGSDVGAAEFFEGILKEDPFTGTETAIGDGVICSLVAPTPGHRYRIRCNDMGANKETGAGVTFSATAYKADLGSTLILAKIGRLSMPYVDDDTVCEVKWGGD